MKVRCVGVVGVEFEVCSCDPESRFGQSFGLLEGFWNANFTCLHAWERGRSYIVSDVLSLWRLEPLDELLDLEVDGFSVGESDAVGEAGFLDVGVVCADDDATGGLRRASGGEPDCGLCEDRLEALQE